MRIEREREVVGCLINDICALAETTGQISLNDTIWYGVPAIDVPLCVACPDPGVSASRNIDTAEEDEGGAGPGDSVEYPVRLPAVSGRRFIYRVRRLSFTCEPIRSPASRNVKWAVDGNVRQWQDLLSNISKRCRVTMRRNEHRNRFVREAATGKLWDLGPASGERH